MDERYVAYAIPVFFALIALEALLAPRAGRRAARLHDAIANLSCGVGQQVVQLVLKGALAWAYVQLHARAATLDIGPTSVPAWIACTLLVDLAYYAFHRASHRVNVIWAGHIVHHQSEDMNLTVALRQSWFVDFALWAFLLPLAVIGFPPVMVLVTKTFNTLYQFWIHTELVDRAGPLELVLNTPSHHRVHHGVDPKYIDKNYAGIFIIWDKLFGTFQAEEERPTYGTVKPFASWNPWWANLSHWADVAELARRSPRAVDKLRVWFMPPDWRPAELGGRVTIPGVEGRAPRFDVPTPARVDAYVATHFVLTLAATTALLVLARDLAPAALGAAIGLVLAALLSVAGLVESRRWALPLELARLAATAGCAAWLLAPPLALAAGAVATASAAWAAWATRPAPIEGRAEDAAPLEPATRRSAATPGAGP